MRPFFSLRFFVFFCDPQAKDLDAAALRGDEEMTVEQLQKLRERFDGVKNTRMFMLKVRVPVGT